MIIQSSNLPMVLVMPEDLSDVPVLRVTMWQGETKLKEWTRTSLQFDGNNIICPFTQNETAKLPVGKVMVEAKWLDADGNTMFMATASDTVTLRRDKTIM